MEHFLIGTAGHVDHGKTTLVKALTNIDTDRLPEEKARGMSIDMGFAFLEFPDIKIGIIDIPGHERFIKNAISGLATVNGLLLIVDAKEGIMPQTMEHLYIAKCFGIKSLCVAITKVDLVDEETVLLAQEEIKETVRSLDLDVFGYYPVSCLEGLGLNELKEGLRLYSKQLCIDRKDEFLKVCLDSAFVVKGHGTVLRGSCVSGKLQEGDTIVVEPIGYTAKVKKLQTHGKFVNHVQSGQRVAINAPSIDYQAIERGFWVIKPEQLIKSDKVILRANIKAGKTYQFFFGMRCITGTAKRVSEDIFLIKLQEPVICVSGDRGPVLSTDGKLQCCYQVIHPLPKRVSKNFIRSNLDILEKDLIQYALLEWGNTGADLTLINSLHGKAINPTQINAYKLGNKLFHHQSINNAKEKLSNLLKENKGLIRRSQAQLKLKVGDEVLRFLVSDSKDLTFVEDFIVNTKLAQLENIESFRSLMHFLEDGIKEEKQLQSYKDILHLCVKRGYVHSLGDFLYIGDTLLKKYIAVLRELGKEFDVQAAKEKLGLTRKYLIPLLEYMDTMGITKREGQRRVFLR